MTAVLDRMDINFLEKAVSGFEQHNGEIVPDDNVPDAYNCRHHCMSSCVNTCATDCSSSCRGFCRGQNQWVLGN